MFGAEKQSFCIPHGIANAFSLKTITASSARKDPYRVIDSAVSDHEPVHITGKRGNAVLIQSCVSEFALQRCLYSGFESPSAIGTFQQSELTSIHTSSSFDYWQTEADWWGHFTENKDQNISQPATPFLEQSARFFSQAMDVAFYAKINHLGILFSTF